MVLECTMDFFCFAWRIVVCAGSKITVGRREINSDCVTIRSDKRGLYFYGKISAFMVIYRSRDKNTI